MTDEELRVRAIQELEFYKKDDTFMLADITVDLAIKALEQMPVTTTAGEGGVIYYPQVEGVTPTVVNPTKTGWIPVSERLPEESLNSVIGWDAYRERCVFVQYIDGYFQITGSAESFDIVAWMPLPKPYEPQERSDKE